MTDKSKNQDERPAPIFNAKQLTERKRHIQTLKNFQGAYEAAAKALEAIKDGRLWRPYSGMEEFCERECGWKPRRFYQIVKYLKIKSKLPPTIAPLVQSERVSRELANVPEEERERVLSEAAATGKVTAAKIKQLAGEVPKLEDKIIELDKTGYPIPEGQATIMWNRRHEVQKIVDVLRHARDMMQELMQMQARPDQDLLYVGVNFNDLYHDMSNIVRAFKEAIPYAVCTSCQGVHPETCVYCKHRGMISQFHYNTTTPKETKEIRKKAMQQ